MDAHRNADEGLRAAFRNPGESALDAIERLTGTRSNILLQDDAAEDSPILRVQHDVADDSRYQIVGEIARGGIGVIYKGRDKELGRDVALKVLRPDFADQSEVVERFVEEAQVGAQLQHPGIVPIYGIGMQPDGRPYIAMKLVKGDTLSALLEQRRTASELIRTFEQIAQTVAYAHSRSVIHRDLKPANIMVGAFGEVQVVDWGFAKVLGRDGKEAPRENVTKIATVRTEDEGSQSIVGSVMGTPAYMPPEQAMGLIDELNERADVFALGAILCEILTRQPPYTGTSQDQLLAAAHARLDEAHERINDATAPEALKQLVRDCLEPLPKDRPANAGVVAQRLTDHLTSVEKRARDAELDAVHAAATVRRVQRARRVTVTVAALVVTAIVAGGVSYSIWRAKEQNRARATGEKVASVMREATLLEGKGEWQAARASASTALTLATTGRADDETLRAVKALHTRIRVQADAAAASAARQARETELIRALDEQVMQNAGLSKNRIEAGYQAAFHAFGLDPESADALQSLRAFTRPVALAIHCDEWGRQRQRVKKDRTKLDRLARALDPDPWRTRLRDGAIDRDIDALKKLANAANIMTQESMSLVWLAQSLSVMGDRGAAVALLRQAQMRHPDNFWLHYKLAAILNDATKPAQALGAAKVAVALRPESGGAWLMLGVIRDKTEDSDGALRAFRKSLRLNRRAVTLSNIGAILSNRGEFDRALVKFRESLDLDSDRAQTHHNIGKTLMAKGKDAAAIGAFRDAIRLGSDDDGVHFNLGFALFKTRNFDASIQELRTAIERDPDSGNSYFWLGRAYWNVRDFPHARDAFKKTTKLMPKFAQVFNDLGLVLKAMNKPEKSIRAFHKAVELAPHFSQALVNLVGALSDHGKDPAAIEAARKGIRNAPQSADVHAILGLVLVRQGAFDDAVSAFRCAHELAPNHADFERRLNAARRQAAILKRVPAILGGDDKPSDEELVDVAWVFQWTKNRAAAARYYEKAFRAYPKTAWNFRYDAACCAALAGEQTHHLALDWLRIALQHWRKQVQAAPLATAKTMLHWTKDAELAGVRDTKDLSDDWARFWADVNALLRQANEVSK